jgi:hypothetical protein
MLETKAYEEIVDFLAGMSPSALIAFRPSEAVQERVAELIAREKRGEITSEEKDELDSFETLEHLMRLAKARARKRLASDDVHR